MVNSQVSVFLKKNRLQRTENPVSWNDFKIILSHKSTLDICRLDRKSDVPNQQFQKNLEIISH